MAFYRPEAVHRQHSQRPPSHRDTIPVASSYLNDRSEEIQEWILFSPSQAVRPRLGTSSDSLPLDATLSGLSESKSPLDGPSHPEASHLGESWAEDGDFDSLDDGLQAFREPSIYGPQPNDAYNTVLPAHDGLGTFPLSTTPVRQGSRSSKRKISDAQIPLDHFRPDSLQVPDLLISDEKRARIERWRSEQCQAILDEVDVETRTQRHHAISAVKERSQYSCAPDTSAIKSTTRHIEPERSALRKDNPKEPFWKRLTVSFVRDVIGIDEPLLSIIVGETLPEDIYALTELQPPTAGARQSVSPGPFPGGTWPDRLLYRIAHDLGLLVNTLSPHHGNMDPPHASESSDYAGIPLTDNGRVVLDQSTDTKTSSLLDQTPVFMPTMQDRLKDSSASHDVDMAPGPQSPKANGTDDERLRRERQYWERELDIKMVFRFLRGHLLPSPASDDLEAFSHPGVSDPSSSRADVIRRHHPLVAMNRRLSIDKFVKQSRVQNARQSLSNCATESLKERQRSSLARSRDSTHNYWDLGASIGSGSVLVSGGIMGAWGEV